MSSPKPIIQVIPNTGVRKQTTLRMLLAVSLSSAILLSGTEAFSRVRITTVMEKIFVNVIVPTGRMKACMEPSKSFSKTSQQVLELW